MHFGVEVYNFQDCPASYCASSPVTLAVERAGIHVGSTTEPAMNARLPMTLAAGDVVHIFVDGVERASVPYEPATADSAPSDVRGRTELSGTLRRGDPIGPPFAPEADPPMLLVDPHTALSVFLHGGEKVALEATGNRWRARFDTGRRRRSASTCSTATSAPPRPARPSSGPGSGSGRAASLPPPSRSNRRARGARSPMCRATSGPSRGSPG